jgi:hypothetical protein
MCCLCQERLQLNLAVVCGNNGKAPDAFRSTAWRARDMEIKREADTSETNGCAFKSAVRGDIPPSGVCDVYDAGKQMNIHPNLLQMAWNTKRV